MDMIHVKGNIVEGRTTQSKLVRWMDGHLALMHASMPRISCELQQLRSIIRQLPPPKSSVCADGSGGNMIS